MAKSIFSKVFYRSVPCLLANVSEGSDWLVTKNVSVSLPSQPPKSLQWIVINKSDKMWMNHPGWWARRVHVRMAVENRWTGLSARIWLESFLLERFYWKVSGGNMSPPHKSLSGPWSALALLTLVQSTVFTVHSALNDLVWQVRLHVTGRLHKSSGLSLL